MTGGQVMGQLLHALGIEAQLEVIGLVERAGIDRRRLPQLRRARFGGVCGDLVGQPPAEVRPDVHDPRDIRGHTR